MAALRLLRIMSQTFQSTSRTKTTRFEAVPNVVMNCSRVVSSSLPTGFRLKVARDPCSSGLTSQCQSLATGIFGVS